jgi:hypothetical protein
MSKLEERRRFLKKAGSLMVAVTLGACASQTDSKDDNGDHSAAMDPCEDFSEISAADLQLRKGFGYVEESPLSESRCNNCNLWIPPKEGHTCGGCTLFKGPVYDNGYCTYWAPVI